MVALYRHRSERLLLASAHTFLLSPELLGDLGIVSPEELDRSGWPSLALLAGRTLRDLALLREARGDKVPALALPGHQWPGYEGCAPREKDS